MRMLRDKKFKFGMQAIAFIEEEMKCTVQEINFEKMKVSDGAIIIAAGLVHDDDTMTAKKVLKAVDEAKKPMKAYEELMTKAMKAFEEAFSDDDGEEEKN